MHPDEPTPELTADRILHLRRAVEMWSDAPPQHQGTAWEHLRVVIATERNRGISWEDLAHQVGQPEEVLRHWFLEPKPRLLLKTPPTTLSDHPAPPGPTGFETRLYSEAVYAVSINELASISENQMISARARTTAIARLSHGGVLVVTGDPRGNQNELGPEVAAIRKAVQHTHVFTAQPCVTIIELTRMVGAYRPTYLHISAHRSAAGLSFAHHWDPTSVGDGAFISALTSTSHRPTLVVLNFCRSLPTAATLSGQGHTAVGWPEDTDDTCAREWAAQFYESLATGQSIEQCLEEANLVIYGSQYPPPEIRGG
ncbi:CHAT domain-containing protein [Nocardia sp. NPDC055029]